MFHVTGSSVDIYNLNALNVSSFDGYVTTGSSFLAAVISAPVSESVSGSFGHCVSINDEWLAVGSPQRNLTVGAVHLYRRNSPGDLEDVSFTYHSMITGSLTSVGSYFGHSLRLNKATGSYSGSLIVGCGNITTGGNSVYYYELSQGSWLERDILSPDRTNRNLPFYDIEPIVRCDDYDIDGYGTSVSLYKDIAVVGAPTDRWIYEYSGSRAYKQGAAYLYKRCDSNVPGWMLIDKFYGTSDTLKNNKLGFSVDVWDDKIIVGCPKSNLETINSCYIEGSIWQQNYCYSNLENYVHGQWILMQKNTSSIAEQWDVVNVYQRKKRFLTPFRGFGYDACIGNKSVVVGAPMIISDSRREFDVENTGSKIGSLFLDLQDISGKSYIYNLNNFRNTFHVGNVFYRNGKLVLNTSGSSFEGLWFNPINEYNYEYEVHFDSKQTLYEKQITCTVEPGEFNVSTNPTAVTKPYALFDINKNGKFDWQDMDVILKYMQYVNTLYQSPAPSTDWSSSVLSTDDEISFFKYQSTLNSYDSSSNYTSQSFFRILDEIGRETFDFNSDSKIDSNDINVFWKYCSNRLNQSNYQSFITPNSKRKLFSDIVDHLNDYTLKNVSPEIHPNFLSYQSSSAADRTGSYLAPYVTTIGLYSGLDLVAVAKLGSPIKLTNDFPINFVVKLDF
jgi:hypothetical protein